MVRRLKSFYFNHSILQFSDDEVNEYQDLDSSFAIEILGRAGLSQYINTPKRKLQEMQPEIKENVLVTTFSIVDLYNHVTYHFYLYLE